MKANVTRNIDLNLSRSEVGGPHSRNSKMTPEMCQAIRRQEGVDYSRVGNGLGLASINNGGGHVQTNIQDRRQTFNRLTQINLDFPGVFLPHVATHQQHRPSRRKPPETGSQTIVLNRSRTTMMPNIQQTKTWESTSVTPSSRKAVMTDLTCLQLADTLFSSKTSPFSGLFNFSQTKSRYMDYFGDDRESEEDLNSESELDVSKYLSKGQSLEHRKPPLAAMKYQTFQADDSRNLEVQISPLNKFPEYVSEYKNKKDIKPQKSILKNGNGDRISNGSMEGNPSNKSYQLPNKPDTHTDYHARFAIGSVHPKLQASHSRNVVNDKQKSPKLEYTLTGVVHDLTSRKRSVRFNAANEIREYTPCEPIKYY